MDVPRVVPDEQRKPLWLYPNLLSLDAPLVAVAWLYIFAKTWRVQFLPLAAYVSLGLVVWMIYVADRLMDASMASGKLESRHEFHRKHQGKFRLAAKIAAVVALFLVTFPLKISLAGFVFTTGLPVSIYGYATIGAVLVVGFFALSLGVTQGPDEIPHAKNVLAGVAFAYGTAMIAFTFTSARSGRSACPIARSESITGWAMPPISCVSESGSDWW